jgi:plasmid stabilization system protein ParE
LYTIELSDEAIADYENRRFAFVRQFPFKVYFLVDDPNQRIVVFAILHNHRDPPIWKKRDKDSL